jgi:hypothetical protein
MRLYLRQLIDCIREARTEVTPPNLELWDSVDVNNEAEVEDISYVEEFIYGTPEPIFVITGILTDLLPLAGTLTNEEKVLLVNELIAVLAHYNFYPDFPEGYPDDKKYSHLRAIWDDEHVQVSFGESHIEMCDFNIEKCPFVGYCNICEEMAKESRRIPETGYDDDLIKGQCDNLLPF